VSRDVDPVVFSNFIPPVIEPLWIMNLFHSSDNSLNFGFEHPEFQALLDEARDTNDNDARFKLQADIAKWMFEHVMTLPLYDENSVFPLGPEIDPWEQQAGGLTWLSDWHAVPHRKN
jgi:ABC-type oligopeptide transport system substrate-binding subunit